MIDEHQTGDHQAEELRELRVRVDELTKTETELRERLQKLQDAAVFPRALLDSVPDLAWIKDEEGKFVLANEAFIRHCGVSHEELIGKSDFDFWPRELAERYLNDDLEVIRTGRPKKIEETLVHTSQGDIWIETIKSPVRNEAGQVTGVAGIARNVSEHKRSVEELALSEAKYRELVQNAKSIIMRFDTQGKITFFNEYAQEFFGFTEQEILGRHLIGSIVPQTESTGRDLGDMIRYLIAEPDRHTPNENENIRSNGERVWVDWTNHGLTSSSGQVTEILSVGTDVTDQRKAQKLLLESGRTKAVSELAGVVAHGLSDLIQIVVGGAQLALINLELGNLPSIKNNLEGILDNLRQGVSALKYLDYLAHPHTETPYLQTKVLDLSRAVHRALDIARPWWKINPGRSGINIVVNRNLGPGCFVNGNEYALFEILISLVKNAVEALPNGGIINVSTYAKDENLVLEVRDNGVGIPQEMLSKIYEPLWTTKGAEATGMGLVRTRNIVEQHRGTLTVESRECYGTTVRVILQRTEPQKQETEKPASEELGPTLNVLIADDSEPLLRVLRDALTSAGHRVFSALSGRKAIEIFDTSRIDVVICDSEMPEINGWQASMAIKEKCIKKGIPKPPIILTIGLGEQSLQIEKMEEYGVDMIYEKPVEICSLVKAVRDAAKKPTAV